MLWSQVQPSPPSSPPSFERRALSIFAANHDRHLGCLERFCNNPDVKDRQVVIQGFQARYGRPWTDFRTPNVSSADLASTQTCTTSTPSSTASSTSPIDLSSSVDSSSISPETATTTPSFMVSATSSSVDSSCLLPDVASSTRGLEPCSQRHLLLPASHCRMPFSRGI